MNATMQINEAIEVSGTLKGEINNLEIRKNDWGEKSYYWNGWNVTELLLNLGGDLIDSLNANNKKDKLVNTRTIHIDTLDSLDKIEVEYAYYKSLNIDYNPSCEIFSIKWRGVSMLNALTVDELNHIEAAILEYHSDN